MRRKIAQLEKIAWNIVLRLAAVKEKFEYKKNDLVRNPNPKGKKEWVTQEWADQFLAKNPLSPPNAKPKSTENVQIVKSVPPAPGKARKEYNQKKIENLRKNPIARNLNKFLDLKGEDKAELEAISRKPGSQVTEKDVKKFVSFFKKAYEESKSWAEVFLKGGADTYAGRWKDEDSLLKKMNGRFKTRTLESVGDIIGNRCVCLNAKDQKSLVDYIYENCVILEHDNSVDGNVRPDGYRAHHFTLQSSDGRLIELQVKTVNQQLYSGFTHPIYKSYLTEKNEDGSPKHPEVTKYTKALSDYIYEIDSGRKPSQPPPQAPEIVLKWLKENGHREFNFDDLE